MRAAILQPLVPFSVDAIEHSIEMVMPPRVAATELEILDPAQVQTVLEGLKGRSIYSVSVIALATGMRRGELLGLRWCDVDIDGAAVRVEQSLEQTKAGLRFKAPKTKHGRRRITLPPSAVTGPSRALESPAGNAPQARHRQSAPTDSLVFPTWEGKPRSPNSLTKEWKEAVRNTPGIPRATLHSLRHTHASHLIRALMS
jgi:integrase